MNSDALPEGDALFLFVFAPLRLCVKKPCVTDCGAACRPGAAVRGCAHVFPGRLVIDYGEQVLHQMADGLLIGQVAFGPALN